MKEDNGFNAEMPVNADLNAIQLEMALQSEAIHSKDPHLNADERQPSKRSLTAG